MLPRSFESRDPSTNEVVSSVGFEPLNEIEQKIEKGTLAFHESKRKSPAERSLMYLKVAELLEQHTERIAQTIVQEIGKPIKQAEGEVRRTAQHFKFYAKHAEQINKQSLVETEAMKSYTLLEPLGLIHIIIPFNFPFWLAFKAAAAYMMIGNGVLVRGSDSTPNTTKHMKEIMDLAGFGDLFQIVFSAQDDLERIVSNPKIKGVSFTGSSRAGSIVAGISGRNLKKCVMELGGSDPFILLEDASISFAVEVAIRSRLTNAGQVCNSSKRFLVHEKIYEEFKEKLIEALKAVRIGNPLLEDTQLGPLARRDILATLKDQISRSVQQGTAQVLYGNQTPKDLPESLKNGNFIEPTVMEVTSTSNVAMNEETFGPLFVLFKVSNSDEALKIANSSSYGLGGVVISKDTARAEEIAKELECGMAFINQVSMSDTRCSSGGVKQSGYGRECGFWGCQEFANIKTIWIENHK